MKQVIHHFKLRPWLSAYLDSELTGETLKRVHSHVLGCRVCQRDLEKIRTGRELLLRWDTEPDMIRRSRPVPRRTLARWGWITASVIAIIALTLIIPETWLPRRWFPSSVHAMDVNFYMAQLQRTNYCAYPCTSLVETTLQEVRSSAPFPIQYPDWVPHGMVLKRVIRYRTPRHEGVGLIFVGDGTELCLFQQPQTLGVATKGLPTTQIRICGRKGTRVDGTQAQFFTWMKDGLCFALATDLAQKDVESMADSLGLLKE